MPKLLVGFSAAAASLALLLGTVNCGGDGTSSPDDNQSPVIVEGLSLVGVAVVEAGKSVPIQVGAVSDADNDPLVYDFTAVRGKVEPAGPIADPVTTYTAPDQAGEDTVTVRVSDAKGGVATASLRFNVVASVEATPPNDGAIDEASARITEPSDGSVVPSEITVEGTASGIEAGSALWTVVHIGGLFWPQRQALIVRDTWTAQAFIGGGTQDSGKQFDVLAVLADGEADRAFLEWLQRGEETGDFPGLSVLPPGVNIMDRVAVSLR